MHVCVYACVHTYSAGKGLVNFGDDVPGIFAHTSDSTFHEKVLMSKFAVSYELL
jgi:hypothetical protein